MSYRIKIPSKTEPLSEAELLGGMERFLLRLHEQRRAVIVGVLVLTVAAAVVAGVFWYDYRASQQAEALFLEAGRHISTRPSDDPKKADENLKKAIELFRQVVDQYPRSPSAPLALYHLGNAQVIGNEFDAAIESYKRFVLLYGTNPQMVGLVQQRLAYAYLQKGDRDQAVKAFTAVLAIPGALNKDQALFELGKLEEAQSRPEGALAHYQELIKTHPQSPFASEAAVRVKALEPKKASEAAPESQNPASSANSSSGNTPPASEPTPPTKP